MQGRAPQDEANAKQSGAQGAVAGRLFRRVLCYALGLFILALGVSFSVKSNLGTSPVSSLPYVLSRILNADMGLITAILFACYALIQAWLLRGQFQLRHLLQVVVGVAFGSFVSVTNRIVSFAPPVAYPLQLALLLLSIFLVGLGLVLVLAADIAPQPPEGLCLTVEAKTGWPFSNVKVGFDCVAVALAAALSFAFLGEIQGVREGTVLAALLVGLTIRLLRKLIGRLVHRLLLMT